MTGVKRPCATPGCRALLERGGSTCCPNHAKAKQPTPRPAKYYTVYGRSWRRLSAAVLLEHPSCAWCGRPATCVDHVLPLAQGGTHDWDNLQALCAACHASKTGAERRARQTP